MSHEEDPATRPESHSNDLEQLIRSRTSRERIKPPGWLSTISKERIEEFLIDRILDNLSALIPDALVELTIDSQLIEDKVSQRKECKEAIENRKREFTFELEKKNLPAFHPWVEFSPKLACVGVAKLRFEYLAQPEIAAKDVRVTLENGRLSEASIDSLDASIQMSMIVDGQPVKLGTIHRRLNLSKRLSEATELPERAVNVTKRPDLSQETKNKTCGKCGANIAASADFCLYCGAKQSE